MENSFLKLPPGFRFHPTDEELVVHYLKRKVQSLHLPVSIPEAEVCKSDPWDLPGDVEQERYLFSTTEIKYPNGKRANRTTTSGYWKATGLDKKILDSTNKKVVGLKKTLVFYRGKPPKGYKTNWIMHEYKLSNPTQGMESWVLCRLFLKKKARKCEEKDEVEKTVGPILYEFLGASRKLDLNLNLDVGCDASSSCSSGITVADEDEQNSD